MLLLLLLLVMVGLRVVVLLDANAFLHFAYDEVKNYSPAIFNLFCEDVLQHFLQPVSDGRPKSLRKNSMVSTDQIGQLANSKQRIDHARWASKAKHRAVLFV